MRSYWQPLLLSLTLFFFSACKKPQPLLEIQPFFEALGDPTRPSSLLSEALYALLDDESKALVDARAKALGAAMGLDVEPSKVLQARGLFAHQRLESLGLEQKNEGEATLLLRLTAIERNGDVPPAKSLRDRVKEDDAVLRMPIRKEGERWKLSIKGFPELLKRVPLEAEKEVAP